MKAVAETAEAVMLVAELREAPAGKAAAARRAGDLEREVVVGAGEVERLTEKPLEERVARKQVGGGKREGREGWDDAQVTVEVARGLFHVPRSTSVPKQALENPNPNKNLVRVLRFEY